MNPSRGVHAVPSMQVDERSDPEASQAKQWAAHEPTDVPTVSITRVGTGSSDDISAENAARAEEALDRLVESNQVDATVALTLRQALKCAVRKDEPSQDHHDIKDEFDDSQDPDARIKAGKRPFKPSSSKRQQLTAEEAAEIYSMRPVPSKPGQNFRRGSLVQCKTIAPKYGVTAKTVLDIWHGRTWTQATRHLWTEEDVSRREQGQKESDDEEETAEEAQKAGQIAQSAPFVPGMAGGLVGGGHMAPHAAPQLPSNLLLVAGSPGMGQMGMQMEALQQQQLHQHQQLQALQHAQQLQNQLVHHQVYAANMGQQAPNMGQQAPNMGQQAPNMGQHAANMGQQAPNMGQHTANMGQHAPNMGQQAPNMGQQGPNMGHPPPSNMAGAGPSTQGGGDAGKMRQPSEAELRLQLLLHSQHMHQHPPGPAGGAPQGFAPLQ